MPLGTPMTTFDPREASFEAKFAHDADALFRLHARRDKLVGIWAAGKLGLSGEAAADYAAQIVVTDVAAAGDAAVTARLVADLAPHGIDAAAVHAALAEALANAAQQLTDAA